MSDADIRKSSPEEGRIAFGFTHAQGWPYPLETWQRFVAYPQVFYIVNPEDESDAYGVSCVFPQGATASVGATIVSPNHRRKGYAEQLIRNNIAYAASLPHPPQSLLLAATEAGAGVYRRIGFETFASMKSLKGDLYKTLRAAQKDPLTYLAEADSSSSSSGGGNVKVEVGSEDLYVKDWDRFLELANTSQRLERRAVLEMVYLAPDQTNEAAAAAERRQLLPGTRYSLLRSTTDDDAILGFALARTTLKGYAVGPTVAHSVPQSKVLLSALFSSILASAADDNTSSSSASSSGGSAPSVQVDFNITEDQGAHDGAFDAFLRQEWGLEEFMNQEIMEYVCSRSCGDAAVEQTTTTRKKTSRGPVQTHSENWIEKKGTTTSPAPFQFSILDLSLM